MGLDVWFFEWFPLVDYTVIINSFNLGREYQQGWEMAPTWEDTEKKKTAFIVYLLISLL